MLTVTQGTPPKLAVPRPLLRSPIASPLPEFLVAPTLELIDQGTVDGNNQITVSSDLTGIIQIEISGQIYTLSSSPTPTEGTFWYDPATSTITIGGPIKEGETVYVFKSVVTYPTDRLWDTHPTLSAWAIGRIAYQSRLGEPPSINNIEFRGYRPEKQTIETLLNVNYPMIVNGHTYYPKGRTVEETPYQNQVKIKSGFVSQFRQHPTQSNLDTAVKIKPLTIHDTDGDYYTTAAIAAKAKVPYNGISIRIDVPRKISSAATTTLRQCLSRDRLHANKCFVRYDGSAVEVVKWTNVATWAISDDLIKGESLPTLNYAGEGYALDGVPLLVELKGVSLDLDKREKQPGDKVEEKVTGDDDPENPPTVDMGFYQKSFDPNKLRSPSQCFDNGGPTKKRITTKIQNGMPIEELEEVFGFVYTSRDTSDWSSNIVAGKDQGIKIVDALVGVGGNVDNFWQLVKQTKKSYTYSDEGYLEQITTTVKELTRVLKETDQLEAINAYANYWNVKVNGDSLQNPKNAKQDYEARYNYLLYHAYGFGEYDLTYTAQSTEATSTFDIAQDLYTEIKWNPWRTYTTVEKRNNRPLSDFYTDIRKPDEDETDWVPPRFMERRENNIENLAIITDPRSTQKEKKPSLVFGEVSRQEDKVEILSTKNPERYKNITVITNQRGEGLGQAATDRRVDPKSGRPPVVERLETYGRKSPLHDDEDAPKEKYLVTTTGLTVSTIESATIRFPGCYTLDTAKDALKNYLLMENLGALTCTVPLTYAQSYRCGDRCSYGGKMWRILSIVNSQEIAIDGTLRQRDYTIELGIDYGDIPFTVQTIKS